MDLTEQDYRELIDYIIDKLRDRKANDIIRQIEELETASTIEEAPSENKKRASTAFREPNIIYTDLPNDWPFQDVSENKINKKLVRDAVSEYRSRPMTGKEMYLEVIDIIETYLTTVPKIVEKLTTNLGTEDIVWKTENANHPVEVSAADIIRAAAVLNGEQQREIQEIITELRGKRT